MQFKVDLHNHLGREGANPGFDETINFLYNKFGEKFVLGICNNDSSRRYEEFVSQKGTLERHWLNDTKSILFVPDTATYVVGVEEVITPQGHLLVAGIPFDKKISRSPKTVPLEDALKMSKHEFNGINIVAHPFGRDGLGYSLDDIYAINLERYSDLMNQFDGWEVYNSSAELSFPWLLPLYANLTSQSYYDVIKKNFTIGACSFTDGHSVEVIGRSYTNLDMDYVSVGKLRESIRNNKDVKNLYEKPAKWDALKHARNIVIHNLFNSGA